MDRPIFIRSSLQYLRLPRYLERYVSENYFDAAELSESRDTLRENAIPVPCTIANHNPSAVRPLPFHRLLNQLVKRPYRGLTYRGSPVPARIENFTFLKILARRGSALKKITLTIQYSHEEGKKPVCVITRMLPVILV